MVTGLQLALKDFFPADSAAKSHSKDSEAVKSLSFGGILRAKEKQLQDAQTVSASSLVAAVAAVQSLPLAKLVSEMIASRVLAETQAADMETGTNSQAETPEAPLDQPRQAHATVFAVEDTVQTGMPTETPATVAETAAGMESVESEKVRASQQIPPAPKTGEATASPGKVRAQGEMTGSGIEIPASTVEIRFSGKITRKANTDNESRNIAPVTASRAGARQARVIQPETEPLLSSSTIKGHEKTKSQPGESALLVEPAQRLANGDRPANAALPPQLVPVPVVDRASQGTGQGSAQDVPPVELPETQSKPAAPVAGAQQVPLKTGLSRDTGVKSEIRASESIPLQPSPEILPAQFNTTRSDDSAEPEVMRSGTNVASRPVEGQRLAPEVSREASSAKNTHREPVESAGQPFSPQVTGPSRPAQSEPGIALGRGGPDFKAVPASEPIESQVDKPATATVVDQDTIRPATGASVLPQAGTASEFQAEVEQASTSQAETMLRTAQSLSHNQPAARVEARRNEALFADQQAISRQSVTPEPVTAYTQNTNGTSVNTDNSTDLNFSGETQTIAVETAVQMETADLPPTQDAQKKSAEQPVKGSKRAIIGTQKKERQPRNARLSIDAPRTENENGAFPVAVDFHPAETAEGEHGIEKSQPSVQAGVPVFGSARTPEKVRLDQVPSEHGKRPVGLDQTGIHSNIFEPTIPGPQLEAESAAVMPGQVAIPSEKTGVDSTRINEKSMPVMARPQSGPDTVEKIEVPIGEKNLTERVIAGKSRHESQPVYRAGTPDSTSVRPVQRIQPDLEGVGKEVPVVEKISADKRIATESRPETQPKSRVAAPSTASVRPTQGAQSTPVEPADEFTVVETKVDKTRSRAGAPAGATRQVGNSGAENDQTNLPVETSSKASGHRAISGQAAMEFERVQTVSESKAPMTGKSLVSGQPARLETAQPVVMPDAAIHVQPRQAARGSAQSESGSEKSYSPELGKNTNPGMEPLPAQAPLARESFVERVAGRGGGKEAEIRAAEVVQQIVHHVESRSHTRSTEMHLQLNPKELGVIDVQMVSGPQGVSVTFSAEQPATGRLLETQLNQLQQALTDAGVQISGLNIGQHGQPRQEGGFLNQNPQFAQPAQHIASRKEADMPEPRRPERVTGASGEVDYLI